MKPETILAYNSGKFGIDCVDQMTKHYTSKVGSRRSPLAVFYNIIVISGINAWILYRECAKSNISRREFLLKLSQQLCKFNQLLRVPKRPASQTEKKGSNVFCAGINLEQFVPIVKNCLW